MFLFRYPNEGRELIKRKMTEILIIHTSEGQIHTSQHNSGAHSVETSQLETS